MTKYNEYNIGDTVEYEKDGEIFYGEIEKIDGNKIYVTDFCSEKEICLEKENVKVIPPVYVDAQTFKKFVRYEIGLSDLNGGNIYRKIINKDNYTFTPDDVLCAVKKWFYEEKDDEKFICEWFGYFELNFIEADTDVQISNEYTDNNIYIQKIILNMLYEMLEEILLFKTDVNISAAIRDMEIFLEDSDKPLSRRRIPDYAKEHFLEITDRTERLKIADEETVALYRKFALELCEKDNTVALNSVGYGSYGGNRAFPCDWKLSEECMLRLLETEENEIEKAQYANTLGYIYYYGRCNNGTPEYDKAYKYFSFAAFNGIYEALYKVADMMKNGYGVAKSVPAAQKIVTELYYENLKEMHEGNLDCKFADIAFRMGNFVDLDNSCDFFEDCDKKLRYYFQAEFAIRMRMLEADRYGDLSVKKSIETELEKFKEDINFCFEKKISVYDLSICFEDYLSKGYLFDVNIRPLSQGKYKLTFKLHKKANKMYRKRMFLTIPQLGMCGYYDSLSVIAIPSYMNKDLNAGDFVIDEIIGNELRLDGKTLFISDEIYPYEIKAPTAKEKTYRFAAGTVDNLLMNFEYLCEDETVCPGDKFNVDIGLGESVFTVLRVYEKKQSEIPHTIKFYDKLGE